MLHTEPSFCIYSNEDKFEDDAAKEDYIREKLTNSDEKLERSATIGDSLDSQFSFARSSMGMIKEDDYDDDDYEEAKDRVVGRFADLKTGNHGNDDDVRTYYSQMISEYPHDPLALRDYAQYLELADPEDGLTLSRLAKLVWDQHHDKAKASTYFERSTRAAPEDSDVLAAYASFLWETDENDEDDDEEEDIPKPQINDFKKEERPKSPPLHLALGLGIGPAFDNASVDSKIDRSHIGDEEYYVRLVEENPCNPLYLRDYARFLHQSKGDVHGAEEYYSRAILTNPSDGETLMLYAQLIWDLHRDKDRAHVYFQQALLASPEDSNVLAAYAKFLWESEDE